jgi:hypothetical protein
MQKSNVELLPDDEDDEPIAETLVEDEKVEVRGRSVRHPI